MLYNSVNILETIELLILTECAVWHINYILVKLRQKLIDTM